MVLFSAHIEAFIRDCMVEHDGAAVTKEAVHLRYIQWCNEKSYGTPLGKIGFFRFLYKVQPSLKQRVWHGKLHGDTKKRYFLKTKLV